jgi:hypothetical protein
MVVVGTAEDYRLECPLALVVASLPDASIERRLSVGLALMSQ